MLCWAHSEFVRVFETLSLMDCHLEELDKVIRTLQVTAHYAVLPQPGLGHRPVGDSLDWICSREPHEKAAAGGTPEKAVAILRNRLPEKALVPDINDECGLLPTGFYAWRKGFFRRVAEAFRRPGTARRCGWSYGLWALRVRRATRRTRALLNSWTSAWLQERCLGTLMDLWVPREVRHQVVDSVRRQRPQLDPTIGNELSPAWSRRRCWHSCHDNCSSQRDDLVHGQVGRGVGVAVTVAVTVFVGVAVPVLVEVAQGGTSVDVLVGVIVGLAVATMVAVDVGVVILVGASVAVTVAVAVAVEVTVTGGAGAGVSGTAGSHCRSTTGK